MSEPTITRALTPKQWDAWGGDGAQPINWSLALACVEVGDDAARHAMAALALHGQPFGFTREDVTELRRLVDAAEESFYKHHAFGGGGGLIQPRALMRSLAARIEALLCPEDPKP